MMVYSFWLFCLEWMSLHLVHLSNVKLKAKRLKTVRKCPTFCFKRTQTLEKRIDVDDTETVLPRQSVSAIKWYTIGEIVDENVNNKREQPDYPQDSNTIVNWFIQTVLHLLLLTSIPTIYFYYWGYVRSEMVVVIWY
jgi:hypothetical protein